MLMNEIFFVVPGERRDDVSTSRHKIGEQGCEK